MVTLENVHKTYWLGRVQVQALRGVSLHVRAGEFTALAGPSGSGKTTLLSIIGCIDKPNSGRIILHGTDLTSIPLPHLAEVRQRKIGFIFQTFNLLPVLTAFENIEYPLLLAGMPRDERRERVLDWLLRVGLTKQRNQRPDQLSGGQRQRVAIARALITDPALVVADEPTANLDSHTASGILDLLQEINVTSRATFLFATHDRAIMERAGRTVHIRDGQVENITSAECAWETAKC